MSPISWSVFGPFSAAIIVQFKSIPESIQYLHSLKLHEADLSLWLLKQLVLSSIVPTGSRAGIFLVFFITRLFINVTLTSFLEKYIEDGIEKTIYS